MAEPILRSTFDDYTQLGLGLGLGLVAWSRPLPTAFGLVLKPTYRTYMDSYVRRENLKY